MEDMDASILRVARRIPRRKIDERTHCVDDRVDASFVAGTDSDHSGGAGLGNQSQIRRRESAEFRACESGIRAMRYMPDLAIDVQAGMVYLVEQDFG
jgi:hypothetical protein